ncbi:MAG TPA: ImmA/IrrE family metallo-endopeptidase [Pyrinomonadaceae bacterium]|nr:ImmA/IrrE family metallo-endopeptidase [Pyrinomonadaceae bacterium]
MRQVYGSNKSPVSLFIEKALEVRQITRVQGPAYNPFSYAEKLNIRVEEKKGMMLDGFLRCDQLGNFTVRLKRDAPRHRRNFTLAHEISHTFFYELLNHPKNTLRDRGFDPEEEFFCDLGAAELLMPPSTFKKDLFSDGSVTPQTLFWLVSRYDVSLQAVANRMSFLAKNLACVFWRKRETLIEANYVTPSYLKNIVLCQTKNSSVELAYANQGSVVKALDSYYGLKKQKRIRRQSTSLATSDTHVISIIDLGEDLRDQLT